jgi:hypothetical protein
MFQPVTITPLFVSIPCILRLVSISNGFGTVFGDSGNDSPQFTITQ